VYAEACLLQFLKLFCPQVWELEEPGVALLFERFVLRQVHADFYTVRPLLGYFQLIVVFDAARFRCRWILVFWDVYSLVR
jgi:hypothetical protein